MRLLRRLTAVTGVGLAVAAVGPISSAFAATTPLQPPLPLPTLTSPLTLPGLPGQQSSDSCTNQGLLPGIPNLGPTGPLGPLGADGPLGAGHLPCGLSVFDLGPTGPLGPDGPLGSGGQQ
jgi:hypothetical protein